MIEIDAWHILGVEPDDLTGADRDLLWLVAGMLDYRHPFPVDSLAREGNERQDSVTGDRHAFVRERRDSDECEIEFGVAIENFVRTQIEADRLLQHAVEVVLIAEFSFGLACLVGIAEHVMVGEQEARPDKKTRAVPGSAVARDFDSANRRGRPPAAIEEINRHQVAVADDALEPVCVAAV